MKNYRDKSCLWILPYMNSKLISLLVMLMLRLMLSKWTNTNTWTLLPTFIKSVLTWKRL